jgi:hypothetical protein
MCRARSCLLLRVCGLILRCACTDGTAFVLVSSTHTPPLDTQYPPGTPIDTRSRPGCRCATYVRRRRRAIAPQVHILVATDVSACIFSMSRAVFNIHVCFQDLAIEMVSIVVYQGDDAGALGFGARLLPSWFAAATVFVSATTAALPNSSVLLTE